AEAERLLGADPSNQETWSRLLAATGQAARSERALRSALEALAPGDLRRRPLLLALGRGQLEEGSLALEAERVEPGQPWRVPLQLALADSALQANRPEEARARLRVALCDAEGAEHLARATVISGELAFAER